MNEEISMILKMVEEGKISADKAKELIDALGSKSKNTEAIVPKKYEDKFLRVEVLSHEGDKVNVKLPISTSIEGMNGIDIDELMNTIVSCLDNEVMGEIVDVCSSEGDIVKIVID